MTKKKEKEEEEQNKRHTEKPQNSLCGQLPLGMGPVLECG